MSTDSENNTPDTAAVTEPVAPVVSDTPVADESAAAAAPAPPTQDDPRAPAGQEQLNLLEVPIDSEHAALNIIVGFLGIAQRRGAFAINESAKIFECVKMFQKKAAGQ